jgi:dephospho-CoA kinase
MMQIQEQNGYMYITWILKMRLFRPLVPRLIQLAGQVNRSYLANQVFNNTQSVALLNKLVHPRVGADYQVWVSNKRMHLM